MIINVDENGSKSVYKPENAVDFNSDEFSADLIDKDGKIIISFFSERKGWVNEIVSNMFK